VCVYVQLLSEFEKLSKPYEFDEATDWWKVLKDKINENQRSLMVCIVS